MILTGVIFTGDQSPAASILKNFILPARCMLVFLSLVGGREQWSSAVAPGAHIGHWKCRQDSVSWLGWESLHFKKLLKTAG